MQRSCLILHMTLKILFKNVFRCFKRKAKRKKKNSRHKSLTTRCEDGFFAGMYFFKIALITLWNKNYL